MYSFGNLKIVRGSSHPLRHQSKMASRRPDKPFQAESMQEPAKIDPLKRLATGLAHDDVRVR